MRLSAVIAAVATLSLAAAAEAPDAGLSRPPMKEGRKTSAPDGVTPRSAAAVTVRGRATSEAHYCGGGAAATDQEIREARRSTALPNETFSANPGQEIDLSAKKLSFTTTADASFAVTLPPGTWCVYRASRTPVARDDPHDPDDPRPRPPRGSSNLDADCLEREKFRCDQVIEVGAEPVEANIVISVGCPEQWYQPCWIGPMPP